MFEIYRERPILAWSVTALGGLLFVWLVLPSGRNQQQSASGDYATLADYFADPNMQLEYGSMLASQQLSAMNEQRAIEAEFAYRTAELAVSRELQILGFNLQGASSEREYNLNVLALNNAQEQFEIQAAAQRYNDRRAFDLQEYIQESNIFIQSQMLENQRVGNILFSNNGRAADYIERLIAASTPGGPVAPWFIDTHLRPGQRPFGGTNPRFTIGLPSPTRRDEENDDTNGGG